MISGIGILLDPMKRNRGGRCCKKQLLERRQFAQDRLPNGVGEFAQKTFESLYDVKKHWLIHL